MKGFQKKDSLITEEQLKEYFDKGGTITKCAPGERTEDIEYKGGGFYGKKKKKEAKE